MARRFQGIGELIRPLWPFTINGDSPQAQGLACWLPLGYFPGSEPDLSRNRQFSAANTTTVAPDPRLRWYRRFNGGYLTLASAIVSAVPLSMTCWFNADLDSAFYILMMMDSSGDGNQSFVLAANGSTAGDPVQARTRDGVTGSSIASSTTGFAAGSWYHAGGVWAAANDRRAFVNGGSKGTQNTSRTPTGLDQSFVSTSDTANDVIGNLADCRWYSRDLTDLEMASYFSDPRLSLDLYYPLGRKVWSFPRAAAQGQPTMRRWGGIPGMVGAGRIGRSW